MNVRNAVLAGIATGALLVSCGTMAALNQNEIHLALDSLRLALVKMGVANAMLSNPVPPSNNAEAHVAAAGKMTTREIGAILVGKGGVINVYFTPVVGITGGIVQLVPKVVSDSQGRKSVRYTCFSPNIKDIATAAPDCTYRPARNK